MSAARDQGVQRPGIPRQPRPDAPSRRYRYRSHLRTGRNRDEFEQALREGRCGIGPITNTEMSRPALSERCRGQVLRRRAIIFLPRKPT